MWRVLAWSLEASKSELRVVYRTTRLALLSFHGALEVSFSTGAGLLPRDLLLHPGLEAAVGLVLGSALPGLIINYSPYMGPDCDEVLEASLSMLVSLGTPFLQNTLLLERMHPLALRLWTEAAAAVRRWPQQAHLGTILRVRR